MSNSTSSMPSNDHKLRIFSDRAGSSLPPIGVPFKESHDRWVVPTWISRGRYVEDASSLGGSHWEEYEFLVRVRPANGDEVTAHLERHAAARIEREALLAAVRFVDEVADFVKAQDDRPRTSWPEGLPLFDSFDIYGGGSRFVLEDDGQSLWYIRNNGMDGDAWDCGNLGNSIGYRGKVDAEMRDRLLDLAERYSVLNRFLPELGVYGATMDLVASHAPRNNIAEIRQFRQTHLGGPCTPTSHVPVNSSLTGDSHEKS